MSSGQLNVSSEEKVFHAVLNWVKQDLPSREPHVAKVSRPLSARPEARPAS